MHFFSCIFGRSVNFVLLFMIRVDFRRAGYKEGKCFVEKKSFNYGSCLVTVHFNFSMAHFL